MHFVENKFCCNEWEGLPVIFSQNYTPSRVKYIFCEFHNIAPGRDLTDSGGKNHQSLLGI